VEVAAENIGRQVVQDAAVDQKCPFAIFDWRKDAGNGDGGAKRPEGSGPAAKVTDCRVFRSVATQRKGMGIRL